MRCLVFLALLSCSSCVASHLAVFNPDPTSTHPEWSPRRAGWDCDPTSALGGGTRQFWVSPRCQTLAESIECDDACWKDVVGQGPTPLVSAYHPAMGVLGRTRLDQVLVHFGISRRLVKFYDRPALDAASGEFLEGDAFWRRFPWVQGVKATHLEDLTMGDDLSESLRPALLARRELLHAFTAALATQAEGDRLARMKSALVASSALPFLQVLRGTEEEPVFLAARAHVQSQLELFPEARRKEVENDRCRVSETTTALLGELEALEAAPFREQVRLARKWAPPWPRAVPEEAARQAAGPSAEFWLGSHDALSERLLAETRRAPEDERELKVQLSEVLTALQVGISDELAAFLTGGGNSTFSFGDGLLTLDQLRRNDRSFARFSMTPPDLSNDSTNFTTQRDVTVTTGGGAVDRSREAALLGELDALDRKLAALRAFSGVRREADSSVVGFRCDRDGLNCRGVRQGGGESASSYWSRATLAKDIASLEEARALLLHRLETERRTLAASSQPSVTKTERHTFVGSNLKVRGRVQLLFPDGTSATYETEVTGSPAQTSIDGVRRQAEDRLRDSLRFGIDAYLRRQAKLLEALEQRLEAP